jgi:ubiquinone/menaquinone biosynthesis C-methylase UbiE
MDRDDIERWSPVKAWLYNLFNRNPKSNRAVIEFAELGEEDHFLDIGCGPGAALEHAASTGASVAGVDPSKSMVSRAARRVPTAEVRVGSAEEVPFPDDTFSVVINIASFHHWADREAGLREISRVLAPGGRLHIVEGALREGKDGHGLNPRDAEILNARLSELGYTRTSTERIKPGWIHEYFVVNGVAPEGVVPDSDS